MLIFPSQCKFRLTFPFQSSYYLFFTFIILSILLLRSVNFACGTINLGTKYLALAARMKTLKEQVSGFSNRFLRPWSLTVPFVAETNCYCENSSPFPPEEAETVFPASLAVKYGHVTKF